MNFQKIKAEEARVSFLLAREKKAERRTMITVNLLLGATVLAVMLALKPVSTLCYAAGGIALCAAGWLTLIGLAIAVMKIGTALFTLPWQRAFCDLLTARHRLENMRAAYRDHGF